MLREFVLDIHVILLDVRPQALRVNGVETERERAAGANVGVTGNVGLSRVEHEWWRGLQCLNVLLIAVAMLEEDSVSATHRPLAIALGVPGKAKPGSGVE